MTDEERRKEWHRFFISTSFTDSEREAKETGKRYVKKERKIFLSRDPMATMIKQEQGDLTGWS